MISYTETTLEVSYIEQTEVFQSISFPDLSATRDRPAYIIYFPVVRNALNVGLLSFLFTKWRMEQIARSAQNMILFQLFLS